MCGADAPRLAVVDRVRRGGQRFDFRIVHCGACGFEYVTPRASGGVFGTEPGGGARGDAAVANSPIYTGGLAELRAAGMGDGGRILDLGCARGDFLAFAAGLGFEVVGVEINPSLAAEARQRGFEVHYGDLRSLQLAGAFDAVTLWDVIEHVEEPVSLLSACRDAVRPGGLVLLHTGNARFQIPKARLLAAWRPDGGPYLVPHQHLTHFDPATARRAMQFAGLEPLRVFSAGTLHYRRRGKRLAIGVLNRLGALSARLGGPLLTNAMGVIARRPVRGS